MKVEGGATEPRARLASGIFIGFVIVVAIGVAVLLRQPLSPEDAQSFSNPEPSQPAVNVVQVNSLHAGQERLDLEGRSLKTLKATLRGKPAFVFNTGEHATPLESVPATDAVVLHAAESTQVPSAFFLRTDEPTTDAPAPAASKYWWWPNHKSFIKSNGAAACFDCHVETNCADCHVSLPD